MLSSLRYLVVWVRIVPLILVVIMIGGCTSHPCWVRSGGSMVYLSSLCAMATMGNLSLQ